ncbi:MAG TPA: hypothetical protein VF815_13855 [Myxococcaceae bacterium]|jgi:hypothetical protein
MPSAGPKQRFYLSARQPAYLPRALFVTLGLFFVLSLLTASGAPLGLRLAGSQLLEKLLEQKQLFFRLLFASRSLSIDMTLALASHLIRRTRSVVQARGPLDCPSLARATTARQERPVSGARAGAHQLNEPLSIQHVTPESTNGSRNCPSVG